VPKPILPDDVSPDMRVGKLASLLIAAKVEEVARYADAAMSGDVDGVHDMRVAVKRLREGMRVFSQLLPGKHRKRTMPMVEDLNDALGRVRDPDVMAEHARALLEHAPEAADAVEAVIAGWEKTRAREHEALVRRWRRMVDRDDIYGRLESLVDRVAARKRDVNRLRADSYAYVGITERMGVLSERLQAAREDPAPEVLHRLRLGIKRLKYTMEPFLKLLPDLKAPYEVVSDAQETLGLTHDFDALRDALIAGFDTVGAVDTTDGQSSPPGVDAALEALDRQRAVHYDESLALMEQLGTRRWRASVLRAFD